MNSNTIMTDLDETEVYASAALFTLALYSSQVEVGVDRFQENSLGEYRASAWGCPQNVDLDEVVFKKDLNSEVLKHFWGWDCCGANGLCQSLYRNLGIPEKRWTGLLKIPETVRDISTEMGIDDLIEIVEHYSRMLDPELRYTKGKAVELFSIQRKRSIDLGDMDLVAAICVEEETELAPSSSREHRRSFGKKLFEIAEGGSDSNEDSDQATPLLENDEPSTEPPSLEAKSEEDLVPNFAKTRVSAFAMDENFGLDDEGLPLERDSESEAFNLQVVESLKQLEELKIDENEDVVIPRVGFKPRNNYHHAASGASCMALRFLVKSVLLENSFEEKEEKEAPISLQWYDARCRIALMRTAHWLRIPWMTMVAFETEAALDLLRLKENAALAKKSISVSRWLKISAMAIGGGAAVAITGGLAAPAVAAGLGAAVTLVGGGAAAATAVTGFAASTAGTATITTAFGAFGASSTGSTMYNRTNDVREFAFWDLSKDWTSEIEKKKQRSAQSKTFWSWSKSKDPSSTSRGRSLSMFQLPFFAKDTSQSESDTHDDNNRSEPVTPSGESTYTNFHEKQRIMIVPGVEVDLDDLESTKASSNYSEWWDAWTRAKERPDLLTIPVTTGNDNSKMALTIALSGVVNDDRHFIFPWKTLPAESCDRFAVVWESDLMKKVNDSLLGLISSQAANEAAKWFIRKYLYTGLLSAVAIPVLITTIVNVTVGNNWALAMDRSLRAGELLAQYFIQGLHGYRPVTLIGYSSGARAIFRCLLTLYNAGKRGVIENVILLGAPVSLTDYKWARARSVVAGRFVNGYSTRDWVLGIIFRVGRGVLQNVAGISPVNVPGIENIDLSAIVSGQTEYSICMKDILTALNV